MSSRGTDFERKIRKQLEANGWWVCRAAGSLGDADLVALSNGHAVPPAFGPVRLDTQRLSKLLIECKTTAAGPYADFGPRKRLELIAAARRAGASAWLAYRPPYARQTKWIHESEFPK